MSLAGHLRALGAGYDSLTLRAPAAAVGEQARLQAQAATVRALTAWCLQGAVPTVRQRLAVGALRGAVGAEAQTLVAWADAFARQLDGGMRLDAMPTRAAGLAWRLQTKLNDARIWRKRQPDDPWDAGWAQSRPPALRRLQTHWMPRRATLLLADAADHEALRLALTALWQRHESFRHPVRWLWVGAGTELPAAPGQTVARFGLGVVLGPG